MQSQSSNGQAPEGRGKEWWDAFNAACRAPMNGDSKAVLMALLSYADGPGKPVPLGNSRPGVQRLMEHTGLTRRPVQKKLRELEAAGWIVATNAGGGEAAATYMVTVPAEVVLAGGGVPGDAGGAFPGTPGGRSWERPTDGLPSHNRRDSRFTAAGPQEEGQVVVEVERAVVAVVEEEGNGDRIEQGVMDAVQAVAASRSLVNMERLMEVVSRKHGPQVAEWMASPMVNYGSDLVPADASYDARREARYLTGWKVRELLNTAHAAGMWVMNLPAPRNTGVDESLIDEGLLAELRASLDGARAEAPAVPVVPADTAADGEGPVDLEAARAAQLAALEARFGDLGTGV